MSILHTYTNGNYAVKILDDGTKIRFTKENEFLPSRPESVDLKITNYCDGGSCSKYCHEQSSKHGENAILNNFWNLISLEDYAGLELAIGGGNPLVHPELPGFLYGLKARRIIPNLTVSKFNLVNPNYQKTLSEILDRDLIYGLGYSIGDGYAPNYEIWEKIIKYPHTVVHAIIGIHSIEQVLTFLFHNKKYYEDINPKILLLGYKCKGNGQYYYGKEVEQNIEKWKEFLSVFMDRVKTTVCFDNLSVEQLEMKKRLSEQEWENSYMGDDGQFTMYIDLVKNQYAKSSTEISRTNIETTDTLKTIFRTVRETK